MGLLWNYQMTSPAYFMHPHWSIDLIVMQMSRQSTNSEVAQKCASKLIRGIFQTSDWALAWAQTSIWEQ